MGNDGLIDADDIDYVFANFGDWSDLADAASMDLSADITGDLVVDFQDVQAILDILAGNGAKALGLGYLIAGSDQALNVQGAAAFTR